MLSITHTGVALCILALPLPLYVTVPLALISHALADSIGEETYPGWINLQIVSHIMLFIYSLTTWNVVLMLSGMLLGNGMDIFDKIISKKLFKKEIIHSNKHYPKIIKDLNGPQTKRVDIIMALISMIVLWLCIF